eukprot:m.140610 g.140610  ORF g.140610 m.140610 type:complete len:236 (-) comp14830_c0_seq1:1566-2273(-)
MSSPIADFEKELAAVAESGKGQVSQRRVQLLTKLALTHRKHYKLIVHAVEKFIHKARSDYKLPGLYVLDSIVRASKAKLNDNCYAERFGKNLALTVTTLLKTSSEHQIKMKKVFDIWHQKKIFPGPVLAGLLPSNQSPKIITDLSAGQSLSGGGGTAMVVILYFGTSLSKLASSNRVLKRSRQIRRMTLTMALMKMMMLGLPSNNGFGWKMSDVQSYHRLTLVKMPWIFCPLFSL